MRLIDADALKDGYMHMGYDPNEHPEESYMEGWCKGFNAAVDHCIGHVIHAPSIKPEPQWIPVTERLPEVGTYVLVSKKALGFRSNLPNVCTAHRSRDPRSGKEEWNDMLFGKLDDDDVLAWMPLPEPYREEGAKRCLQAQL